MSLTEREKEIAQEFGIPLRDADSFLSRIREEQKPIAWVAKDTLDGPFTEKFMSDDVPLFAIPPAATDCDCKELVEALEKIADTAPDEGSHQLIALKALAKHKASMGEK